MTSAAVVSRLMLSPALAAVLDQLLAGATVAPLPPLLPSPVTLLGDYLQRAPGKAQALELFGLLGFIAGDTRRAAVLLQQAADAGVPDAARLNNFGLALLACGQRIDADQCFRRAADLLSPVPDGQPPCTEHCLTLGRLLMMRRLWSAAALQFEAALTREPQHLQALCLLAEVADDTQLSDLSTRLERARMRAADPAQQYQLQSALAALARLRGDSAAELQHYRCALRQRPDCVVTRIHLAKWLLLHGDYVNGWPAFEWRWRQCAAPPAAHDSGRRRWSGEALHGARIVLLAEQGLGSVIQFARYAPLVAALGARVVLVVPRSLKHLMMSLDAAVTVMAADDPLPPAAWQCPLMSLPVAFGTTLDSVPSRVPYLSADPPHAHAWRLRLRRQLPLPQGALRVGVVWAGSAGHYNDRRRSLAPALLAPLAQLAQLRAIGYVALQKHAAGDPYPGHLPFPCLDLGAELDSFATTAAIIAGLDLVISVDTAVAHLAGALGKPVWILLPFAGEYRWLREREDSPWYPSARLFRQPRPGDWVSVIQRLTAALRARLAVGVAA